MSAPTGAKKGTEHVRVVPAVVHADDVALMLAVVGLALFTVIETDAALGETYCGRRTDELVAAGARLMTMDNVPDVLGPDAVDVGPAGVII